MADFLEGELGTDGKLHLMEGINSDSGKSCTPAAFEGDEKVLERALVDRFPLSNCGCVNCSTW